MTRGTKLIDLLQGTASQILYAERQFKADFPQIYQVTGAALQSDAIETSIALLLAASSILRGECPGESEVMIVRKMLRTVEIGQTQMAMPISAKASDTLKALKGFFLLSAENREQYLRGE